MCERGVKGFVLIGLVAFVLFHTLWRESKQSFVDLLGEKSEMIVQPGHNFFGSAQNNELKEPKSFLAHLRENIETSLYTTTTTARPKVVAPIIADNAVVPPVTEPDRASRIFGDKKVATFYLHMSIAISTFIVLIFMGISAYYCYKR